MVEWHALSVGEVFSRLGSSRSGLSTREVEKRLGVYGLNVIVSEQRFRFVKLFFNQFKSLMVLILLVGGVVSLLVGEFLDAFFIFLIVLANSVLGFFQEFKAERALDSLKKLSTPKAVVLRDGVKVEVSASELVPGDVIFLSEGSSVPADARLVSVNGLMVDESLLTGESSEVVKSVKKLGVGVGLVDRRNMVFMGTLVTRGSGVGVVVGTGLNTEMGGISKLVESASSKRTPLQVKLDRLSKYLAGLVFFMTLIIFGLTVLNGGSFVDALMVSISLAVSAIPEGLPAVVTITLALGVQRMAGENALVRKLNAAETLGSTTVICTDKTGTLTRNEMTVSEFFLGSGRVVVEGDGYDSGVFLRSGELVDPLSGDLFKALEVGVLCNNASLQRQGGEWSFLGDRTEVALLVVASRASHGDLTVFSEGKRFVSEVPFSSDRMLMSKVFSVGGESFSFVKGAPEVVFDRCSFFLRNGKLVRFSSRAREVFEEALSDMSSRALRVLALGFKRVSDGGDGESGLVLVGLVGMYDPPREGVREALLTAREAGVRTVMVTGDHVETARAIALEVGLVSGDPLVVSGVELDRLSDAELLGLVDRVSVFARVSPVHKVRILKAFQEKGHVVAVTGDGVNDAPALKSADIGVAMGLRGTDVAKSSADIVLLDDNYVTIVKAIREGRRIFDNVSKFVRYLLSANFGEVLVVGLSVLLGLPLPLTALELLWINLVTDGFPALALGVDPVSGDVMKRKPVKRGSSVLRGMVGFSVVSGVFGGLVGVLLFFVSLSRGLVVARTIVFSFIVVFELLLVFSVRSLSRGFFYQFFRNESLLVSVLFSFVLQLLVVYSSVGRVVFGVVSLGFVDWLVIVFLSVLCVGVLELFKFLRGGSLL